jgi:hypothetical protein
MQPDPFLAEEDFYFPPEEAALPPEMPTDSPEWPTFARAVQLIKLKASLTRELKDVTDELSRLQPLVAGYFSQRDLPKITIGDTTLFIRRQLWARAKKDMTPQACAAMRATGFDHFVHDTFNVSSFSAHVRELERDNIDRITSGEIPDVSAVLPAPLAATLNITTDVTLMGTPAKRK